MNPIPHRDYFIYFRLLEFYYKAIGKLLFRASYEQNASSNIIQQA